jgi:hypothetical protein
VTAVELVLYQRRGCHLCEDLERELRRIGGRWELSLTAVDVDKDPELRARYGDRVPVLETAAGEALCQYFLDEDRLYRYLESG